jgi:hypothetical protein
MAMTHPENINTITLEDGKYAFYKDSNGLVHCLRYGDPWREFLGDKAVSALFDHCQELREKQPVAPPPLEPTRHVNATDRVYGPNNRFSLERLEDGCVVLTGTFGRASWGPEHPIAWMFSALVEARTAATLNHDTVLAQQKVYNRYLDDLEKGKQK